MPDGSAGFEVISVVRRRRSWTPEQKLALVEEVGRPGASVVAVADRHGVSRSLLFEWRRQMREGTLPGVTRVVPAVASAFAPVRVVEEPAPAASPARELRPSGRRGPQAASTIELVLRNGRVLRVAETIRPEVLSQLAAALEA